MEASGKEPLRLGWGCVKEWFYWDIKESFDYGNDDLNSYVRKVSAKESLKMLRKSKGMILG